MELFYSSWDIVIYGLLLWFDWVIIELLVVDIELGIFKLGKEVDVHFVHCGVFGG